MIIVSQNKELIINFNNVIGIQNNESRVGARFIDGSSLTFGTYKTEERAKEVLNEIVNRRAVIELYKYSDNGVREILLNRMPEEKVVFDTYEMPEV